MAEYSNFTVERVKLFKCDPNKSQSFLRDARTPGLGLRVTKGGARTYIFEARAGERVIRKKLGDARVMLLKDAQHAAQLLKRKTDQGIDPRDLDKEKALANKQKIAKDNAELTPALNAWDTYINDRSEKWSERYKKDHEEIARLGGERITRGRRIGMPEFKAQGILRPLLEKPLRHINSVSIEMWLVSEKKTRPTRTRLALSLLTAFLNWCHDYGVNAINEDGTDVKEYPFRSQVNKGACERLKRQLPKAIAKNDSLQREQLRSWFQGVQTIPNKVHGHYLQCLLLTGARRNELANLKWEHVDLKWLTMTIGDKVEETRTIPITPYVAVLLSELKKMNLVPPLQHNAIRRQANHGQWSPSPWVFSSITSASGRIQEPRINHNKALESVGLPALSIHGLRRSFGSLAEWVECPAGISAQIMGHKPSAIAEKHYRVRPIDLLRMWHTKIEAWIIGQAGITPSKANRLIKTA
jgi:integrase